MDKRAESNQGVNIQLLSKHATPEQIFKGK